MSAIAVTEERVTPRRMSKKGEPAWELALLFPYQGYWSEADYLALDTNLLVELSDGCLEVLPMPSPLHQLMVDHLHERLKAFVATYAAGRVFFAPLPVRIGSGKYREPDVVYLRPHRIQNLREQPEGADLVMEVVSEGDDNRKRDLETKREDYAKAGIAEYWIVDPEEQRITVLTLEGDTYRIHGEFQTGAQATSVLFPGFAVDVAKVFSVGHENHES